VSARLALAATAVVAVGIGVWLACTACYRCDDYELLAAAGAGGTARDGLAAWWDQHFGAGLPDAGWPKFHRPVWRAAMLVDAHVFACSPAASAAFSWALHCAFAWLLGRIAHGTTGSRAAGWLAAWLCLLTSSGSEAPTWIAARGSLFATLFAAAAVAIARGTAMRAGHVAAALLLVLLASSSHETGLAAAPLVALGALLHPALPRRTRIGVALAALAVAAGFLAWRAVMLGGFVGGYPGAPERTLAGALDAVVSGTGAAVALGTEPMTPAAKRVLGAAVLALLAWLAVLSRPRRATRDAVLLAIVAIVLFLVPFAGGPLRGDPFWNGRALYAPWAAWSLVLAVALHLLAGVRPRVAVAVGAAWLTATAVTFVTTSIAYHRMLHTAHALFAALRETPWPAGAVLLGMPEHVGPFPVAANAVVSVMHPPFREPGLAVVFANDHLLARGELNCLAPVLPLVPDVPAWHWNMAERRFARGWVPGPVRWSGEVRRDADGALRCGGLRVSVSPGGPSPAPDTWVELVADASGHGAETVLAVRAARPHPPSLERLPAGRWRFRGTPGDMLLLLAGDEPCCCGLGVAGAIGVARPAVLPAGPLDAAGNIEVELPAALAAARVLQPLTLGPGGARLGEVHVLR
jgi:hypothetical protein